MACPTGKYKTTFLMETLYLIAGAAQREYSVKLSEPYSARASVARASPKSRTPMAVNPISKIMTNKWRASASAAYRTNSPNARHTPSSVSKAPLSKTTSSGSSPRAAVQAGTHDTHAPESVSCVSPNHRYTAASPIRSTTGAHSRAVSFICRAALSGMSQEYRPAASHRHAARGKLRCRRCHKDRELPRDHQGATVS